MTDDCGLSCGYCVFHDGYEASRGESTGLVNADGL